MNSISKKIIPNITDEELQDYVVYIDEIDSFLKYTHNEQLTQDIRLIDYQLDRIIRNAHKVIVSDAIIRDNVFEFLKHRSTPVMVTNSYQKFCGVPAQRIRDENTFLEMLSDHIADDDYFWFLADSCNTVTQFGAELKRRFPDKVQDIVLVTAQTKSASAGRLRVIQK